MFRLRTVLLCLFCVFAAACEPHELVWWSTQADEMPQSAYDEACEYDRAGCVAVLNKLAVALAGVVGVGPDAPTGRCASLVSSADVYDWERCAWGEHTAVIGVDAVELVAEIWTDTRVESINETRPPPALRRLIGIECGPGTGGCYNQRTHTIIRRDDTLRTLLHETAHALTSEHPTVQPCTAMFDADNLVCVHNDIFRCVANYLYVRYADLDDAGVCGTVFSAGITVRAFQAVFDPETRNIEVAWQPPDTEGGDLVSGCVLTWIESKNCGTGSTHRLGSDVHSKAFAELWPATYCFQIYAYNTHVVGPTSKQIVTVPADTSSFSDNSPGRDVTSTTDSRRR